MDKKTCAACHRAIDVTAKVCPFCDANPETGTRAKVNELVETVFPPREKPGITESFLNALRARQGVIVAAVIAAVFIILIGLHQFITAHTEAAAAAPAVPLTEVTDLSRQNLRNGEIPMPELELIIEGNAQSMRTFLIEPGAIQPPPELDPLVEQPSPAPAAASGGSPPARPSPAQTAARTQPQPERQSPPPPASAQQPAAQRAQPPVTQQQPTPLERQPVPAPQRLAPPPEQQPPPPPDPPDPD